MKKVAISFLAVLITFSCQNPTCTSDCGVYNPTPYYTCDYIWDTWTGAYTYACFWVYYSQDGSTDLQLDIVADAADIESIMIEKSALAYSEKYSLSFEQAKKIAKNVAQISSLKERSVNDLADFAQKLYGVNPTDLISALSSAQIGNNTELEKLINQTASEFNTSSQNMKYIIKDLHKKALEASGINL